MSDYTIVYVLMICAGLLLGYWYWTKRDQHITPPPPSPTPIPTPKPTPSPKPVPVELAKEIRCIYSYSRSADMAMRRVWVCKNCELENSLLNDNCELCGEPKSLV